MAKPNGKPQSSSRRATNAAKDAIALLKADQISFDGSQTSVKE